LARSLSLWLYLLLADRGPDRVSVARPPRPDGALLWVHAGADCPAETLGRITGALSAARPDLTILVTGATLPEGALDDHLLSDKAPPDRMASVRGFLDHWKPQMGLFIGTALPPALISVAHDRGVALVLADLSVTADEIPVLRRGLVGSVMARFQRILARDSETVATLRRIGGRTLAAELVGRIEDVPDPLPCDESERAALAELLRARPVWLAAGCPLSEVDVVIAAHVHAMSHSHRLLLILMPTEADQAPALAERISTTEGLIVARRAADEDPLPEVQVLITDGPSELGLWYRLAPVTYLGGSLTGAPIRPPHEAAALGSAILHGPETAPEAAAIQRLTQARATRLVASSAALSAAVAELLSPDRAATLATNAWTATSGGAESVERIVAAALGALDQGAPTKLAAR